MCAQALAEESERESLRLMCELGELMAAKARMHALLRAVVLTARVCAGHSRAEGGAQLNRRLAQFEDLRVAVEEEAALVRACAIRICISRMGVRDTHMHFPYVCARAGVWASASLLACVCVGDRVRVPVRSPTAAQVSAERRALVSEQHALRLEQARLRAEQVRYGTALSLPAPPPPPPPPLPAFPPAIVHA